MRTPLFVAISLLVLCAPSYGEQVVKYSLLSVEDAKVYSIAISNHFTEGVAPFQEFEIAVGQPPQGFQFVKSIVRRAIRPVSEINALNILDDGAFDHESIEGANFHLSISIRQTDFYAIVFEYKKTDEHIGTYLHYCLPLSAAIRFGRP